MNKKELAIVIIISLVTLTLALSPLIYGHLNTPKGSVLGGIGRDDEYVYVHYLKQAKEGKWLFHNLYTQEKHTPIFSLLPLLLLGKLARLTDSDIFLVYNLGRVIYDLFFLLISYFFIAFFIKKRFYRILSFLLLCFSSGFGWLWAVPNFPSTIRPHLALANYVTEATTFPSLLFYPHFPASVALMLLCFYFFLKNLEKNSLILLFLSGILGTLVVQSHPYEIVTLAVVPLAFLFFSQSKDFKIWFYYAIFLILLIPMGLYYFWLSSSDPVYKAWIEIPQLSPPIIDFILTYGFLFLPLVLGLVAFLKGEETPTIEKRKYIFLTLWVLATFILVKLPFSFQRRLIMGVHVPLSLLAAVGFSLIGEKLKDYQKYLLASLFILILVPQNLFYIARQIMDIRENPQNFYISKERLALLSYLERTGKEEVILADPSSSLLIPPFSGRKVYLGYWANTLQAEERVAKFYHFLDAKTADLERENFLLESGASYYYRSKENNRYNIYRYWAEADKPKGVFNPEEKDYLEKVFENEKGAIYKIKY